jgi:flavin-dependent dehydrogenase
MNAQTWDAVVIGAGPAGAFAARELARAGAQVLLVERERFPRYKVCGGCINARALDTLRAADLRDVPGEPLTRFHVGVNRRHIELALPGGLARSRAAFDAYLVEKAIGAGVTFREGTVARIGAADDQFQRVSLHSDVNTDSALARVVIVACGLGRTAGAPNGLEARSTLGSRVGAGVIVEGGFSSYVPHAIHMACGNGGYAGLVRVEDGRLNIAAAFDASFVRERGGMGNAAVAILHEAGFEAIPDLAGAPWRGTPQLTRRATRLGAERCLLVGDATGYVEPFTGEGMAWALETARALAPIARRAVDDFNATIIPNWERMHAMITADSQRRCRLLAKALRHPALVEFGVAALNVAPALARPYVRRLNRTHPTLQGDTL